MDTIKPITVEVSAAELPESIVSRLSERPPSDARLRVTVEGTESDEEKFWALKAAIDEGLADSKAGRVVDAEEVFAELLEKYPLKR